MPASTNPFFDAIATCMEPLKQREDVAPYSPLKHVSTLVLTTLHACNHGQSAVGAVLIPNAVVHTGLHPYKHVFTLHRKGSKLLQKSAL